jgi:mRNA interferase MazF
VLANAGRGDWILCQVTSKPYADPAAVVLEDAGFERGSLRVTSYARPGKLFTANVDLVESVVGDIATGNVTRGYRNKSEPSGIDPLFRGFGMSER